MGKVMSLIGYLILVFIIASNYINIELSDTSIILLGILSAIFMSIGIFIKDIPQFEDFISDVVLLAEDGAEVSRYSGFWKDPNFFTVLLNASLWFTYLEFNKSRINIVEFVLRAGIVSFLGLVTMSKSCIILLVIFWLYLLVSKNNIKTTPKVCIIFVSIVLVGVFLYKNPYWFSDIMYRFTSGKDNVTIATVTTGRTEIWKKYFESLLDNMSWIFGQGVNSTAVKINGRAVGAHNTIIQSVYYFGAVGSFLYISLIYSVYNSNHNSTRNNYPHKISPVKFSFLSIMVSLLFLDGVLIEMFYYMLAMSFVYMNINSECNKSEDIDYLY